MRWRRRLRKRERCICLEKWDRNGRERKVERNERKREKGRKK
jgi:hypothetical protein